MTDTIWLWLYVAAMAAGAMLFFGWSRKPSGVPQHEYAIAIFIPIWSGLAYLAMALGQGMLLMDDGRTVYLARYLDWVVTTPLILLLLTSTACFWRPMDKVLAGALMGTDVIMILTGLFADLSGDAGIKWLWYVIGCVCLLLILWMVWGPLRRIAEEQGPELGAVFRRVAGFLTLMWFGYPLIWALGPSGIGLLARETDIMLFVLLPILSKVGFSILDLAELRRLGRVRPGHVFGPVNQGTAFDGSASAAGGGTRRNQR